MTDENTELDKTIKMEPPDLSGKTIELPLDDFIPLRKKKKTSSVNRTATFFTETLALFRDHTKDTEETIRAEQGTVRHHNVAQEQDESAFLGKLDDDYERREAFAGGGQGVISRGKDRHLRRLVAIKSLREEHLNDPAQRGAFIAEARVTAQLEHPAILPIYSIHSDDSKGLHLAMKMVYGQDLKSYLQTIVKHYRKDGIRTYNERKSLRFRLDLFLRICDALSYAHSRNIMHCDLKPENIMIGEYHEAYLMDWGIARQIREPDYDPATWTKPKRITGTPRFLTPEAIRGEHCDERADIYAMGLILYEITTLEEAYSGNTPEAIMRKICMQDMRPVTHLFKYPIDADLKAIILKAAAEDREDRYPSVKALADDLRKYLRNEEVSANPDSLIRKILRWIMHHNKTTLIVMLLCVIVAIGNLAYNLARQIITQQSEFEQITAVQQLEFQKKTAVQQSEFEKKTAIGIAFHNCGEIAYKFDRELSRLENLLIATGNELEFLYNCPTPFSTSSLFRDLNRLQYWSAPGTTHREDNRRIGDTRLFSARFEKLVHGELGKKTTEVSPVTLVGLTFTDGLNFIYPANSPDRAPDPRDNPGFRKRLDPAQPTSGWTTTQSRKESSAEPRTLLTCSVRINHTEKTLPGVLYLTLDINKLMQSVKTQNALQNHAQELTFIDKNGRIILSRKNGQLSKFNGADNMYPDAKLLEYILQYENGYLNFTRNENGKEVEYVCVFTRCQTLGLFYLEIYKLQTLIEQYSKHRIKKD